MSTVRRSWLAKAAGTLLLLGWLAGAGGTEPETCSSPGDFPPPALFPNISSAQKGDLILAQCLVFSHAPITHIFFCKNGVELANHPVGEGQFTSMLAIQLSAENSGTYSCGYRRRSRLGRVMFSRLSVPWLLTTGGGKDDQRNSSIATSPVLPSGVQTFTTKQLRYELQFTSTSRYSLMGAWGKAAEEGTNIPYPLPRPGGPWIEYKLL
ncbi:uncharacterized protein FYN16_004104 [Cariama cristata]